MTAQSLKEPRRHPSAELPNPGPRPPGELEALERIWAPPSGWRTLTVVNNTYIGVYYIGAALLFLVLAGLLALLMRVQLAQPGNRVVGHELYNQLFTMHGTVMMFLFAVPVVEAFGVYLLPNMQAARDLPFPRLSAYAFWAYFIGGLAFFCSLFLGLAPQGGWFMYPPLTSYIHSPGINADFWLLGIGFIEISAIAGAVEIIVGVLKTRAPGQSIDKLPIFSWAMLVFALMIVFAFPAVIVATLLLELERALHWPFFIAERGGDPLLWQHLFWFFGHPEVYVIFLPAAGMVSTMLPTLVHTPLVGYRLVVMALVTTGFLSFGLWVHHMYATGLPGLSLGFFSAASMAVTIPSGIQVFAWIATLASGRLRPTVPAHFLLGFLFIFVLGGLTGVMVAMAPYDWQVHDTYFVVAHLHYVLIGGMVFPVFAALYYWAPTTSRRPLSERLGKLGFWLMFAGVNVTFFTMHLTGLMGMPRRVWTYGPEMGWGLPNLISTVGAFILAAGVAVILLDFALNFRPFTGGRDNPFEAGTLEWLPSGNYQTRSIPLVTSRDPLWSQPHLVRDVEAGRYYLPGSATGDRETIVTSPLEAAPQYVLRIPGPSWLPVLAAAFTAAFFIGLTVQLLAPALLCGLLALGFVLRWMWDCDPPSAGDVHIGGGLRLPTYVSGPASHSWWAMIVLIMVAAATFACLVFSYGYLWTTRPDIWKEHRILPFAAWPLSAALLYASSAGALSMVRLGIGKLPRAGAALCVSGLLVACLCLAGGLAAQAYGHVDAGVDPAASSYGAVVFAVFSFQGFMISVLVVMAAFTLARVIAGKLDRERRVVFDNLALLWGYTLLQGAVMLALMDVVPRFAE